MHLTHCCQVTASSLHGEEAAVFAMNVLTTYSTELKLAFLHTHRDGVCKKVRCGQAVHQVVRCPCLPADLHQLTCLPICFHIIPPVCPPICPPLCPPDSLFIQTLGNESLRVYEAVLEASCCGAGSVKLKIKPVANRTTPYTVRDCLLVSVMVDLTLDIACFEASCDASLCFALHALTAFAERHALGGQGADPDPQGLLACELAAVAHAANLLDKTLFDSLAGHLIGQKVSKAWADQSQALLGLVDRCVRKAEAHSASAYLCLSERLFEADLLDAVPSKSKKGGLGGASFKKKNAAAAAWWGGKERRRVAKDTRMIYVVGGAV
jgi:hypothetical protein